MSAGPDPRLWNDWSPSATDPSAYVSGGEIKIAKLVSTLLGSVWLVFAAGWITVLQAIVQIHISILNAGADMYREILLAFGRNTIEASQIAWGEAFRAAVDANAVLAPAIFSIEIVVVSGLLVGAGRRWF